MNSPEPHDPLARTLADWRVNPPSDPNFRPAVWERIRQHPQQSWAGYLRAHLVGWTLAASLAVVAAGWAGRTAAQVKLDAARERMAVSYLSEIDPRVLAKLRP